jgi:HK97 family phage prohead protease
MNEKNKEIRVLPMTEFRVLKDDGKSSLEGYAARFDKWSEDLGGFKEKIARGAFKKALKDSDVRALFNHDANYVLGRSTAGTLALKEDGKGLFMANDPPPTQWASDLMVSVDRGDISQMSFGFTVEKDEWKEDKEGRVTRVIHEVGRLLDVSVVSFPAYPDTSVALRSLEKSKAEKDKPKFELVEEPKEEVEERELTTELFACKNTIKDLYVRTHEIKTIVSEVIDKVAALKSKVAVEENTESEPMQAEGDPSRCKG